MIESDRIVLKPMERNDLIQIHLHWLNDPKILQWRTNQTSTSLEQLEEWYNRIDAQKDCQHYQIWTKDTIRNLWIGNICLQNINFVHSKAEIAFFIGETFLHGKGYGSESIKLLSNHTFKVMDIFRVYGATPNPAAMRAFEKAGFLKEGTQHGAFITPHKERINIENYYKFKTF